MNKRATRWGCLFAGLLIFILLMAGGGWWYFRSQFVTTETTPNSPVLVFLLSPPTGDEMDAGDFVTVAAQAAAPKPITSIELFVDGQSLGIVTDSTQNASWTWQAWPVGIHTLLARATASSGQVGQSQTVIVNVLAGDGVVKVAAEEGQTLEQIGAHFDVPSDQMAGANPQVDPAQPLADGQPVQVPVGEGNAGDGGAGNGSGQGSADVQPFPLILISWQFKPIEPLDKSYCYTSSGNGIWEKMPKEAFEFFGGVQFDYLQDFPFNENEIIIQMQCWGWLGDALKYMGQGETKFDAHQPPPELTVSGQGFQFIGLPKFQPKEEPFTDGEILTIPPPFAMHKPQDTADCTQHYGNILAGFVCDSLLNGKVSQYYVLEWEWQPKINWPGYETWFNDIDGYRIYEIDPLTKSQSYLKEIGDPNQKVTAVPLSWGAHCYGVQAFTDDPGIEPSEVTTYCPGEQPAPQKTTLAPTAWLTTGDLSDSWYDELGNPAGAVVVSASNFGSETRSSAAVKFAQPALPPGAVIQKATLKFSILWTDYFAHGVAANNKPLCVASVGKAKQDWAGLDGGENHYLAGKNTLSSSAYNEPLTSLPEYAASPHLEVDVTPVLKDWINKNNPLLNYGFIFAPRPSPGTIGEGGSFCESGLGNFQLEIYYFAP